MQSSQEGWGERIRISGRDFSSGLPILSDFSVLGLRTLTPQHMQDMYDLSLMGGHLTTVLTIRLPEESWSEALPDPDAITERIVQKAIRVEMTGESYWKKRFRGGHTAPREIRAGEF